MRNHITWSYENKNAYQKSSQIQAHYRWYIQFHWSFTDIIRLRVKGYNTSVHLQEDNAYS